ncbi:14258_t:CDS:2 [Gigaspora margarita]|uniref:14258_t:CDS:1 n=1 Tax=Gigaspora margarita TaxID=4874 RepID=A0ABN7UIL4_GIGMA|nr:14258_t:CDS:2 [Gigaspora margarita]
MASLYNAIMAELLDHSVGHIINDPTSALITHYKIIKPKLQLPINPSFSLKEQKIEEHDYGTPIIWAKFWKTCHQNKEQLVSSNLPDTICPDLLYFPTTKLTVPIIYELKEENIRELFSTKDIP